MSVPVSIFMCMALLSQTQPMNRIDDPREKEAERYLRRQGLWCLPGVGISVYWEEMGSRRDERIESRLRNDVELRLRKAGVPLLTIAEREAAPSHPELCISVTVAAPKVDSGPCAVMAEVSLNEFVAPMRDVSVAAGSIAPVWRRTTVALLDVSKKENIRTTIGDYVDEFANEFLAAAQDQRSMVAESDKRIRQSGSTPPKRPEVSSATDMDGAWALILNRWASLDTPPAIQMTIDGGKIIDVKCPWPSKGAKTEGPNYGIKVLNGRVIARWWQLGETVEFGDLITLDFDPTNGTGRLIFGTANEALCCTPVRLSTKKDVPEKSGP